MEIPWEVCWNTLIISQNKVLIIIKSKDIMELNVPTGIPLVYELDSDLKPVKNYYLIDEAELKAK